MNASQALMLAATTKFHPFTEIDWAFWQGCESDSPMIGENEGWAIVLDGDVLQFEKDGLWFIFKLTLQGEY